MKNFLSLSSENLFVFSPGTIPSVLSINSMMVMGLVSLSEMTMEQILARASPIDAVRYQ
jgi:ABC-type iron transport system FetAB permease component